MKKMIVLFLVLGVFLAGVVAAVAYSIHIDNDDGYSIVIDNQEHLYK